MRPSWLLWLLLALSLAVPAVVHAAPADDDEARPARLLHYAVLRSGPRETFPVVARVAKGVRVSVVRTRASWSKVTTRSGGASGWVPRDLLGDEAPAAVERRGARPVSVEPDEVAPVTLSRFAGVPLAGRRFEVPPQPRKITRLAQVDPTPAPLAPAAMVEQAAAPAVEIAAPPRPTRLPWLELGVGGGVEAAEHSLRSTSRVPLGNYVSTLTAAAVVPPGEVTPARKAIRSAAGSHARRAAPSAVWRVSTRASSAGRPSFAAPCSSISITR